MPDLTKLPTYTKDGAVHVVVESPRGSNVKLKYDPKLRIFRIAHALVLGTSYPYDWGFVPSTEGEDGDPFDALVLFDGGTFPGVVLECRVIGLVRLDQEDRGKKKRVENDRLIAVERNWERAENLRTSKDLPKRVRQEIERFFETAAALEGKRVKIHAWKDAKAARRELERHERK